MNPLHYPVTMAKNYVFLPIGDEGKAKKCPFSAAPSLGCATLEQYKNWGPVNWSPVRSPGTSCCQSNIAEMEKGDGSGRPVLIFHSCANIWVFHAVFKGFWPFLCNYLYFCSVLHTFEHFWHIIRSLQVHHIY